LRSNESTDLKDEREKSRKINNAQRPQEEPSWTETVTGAMLRVKPSADGPSPVHGRSAIIPTEEPPLIQPTR
jgi:hypothetical protein